MILGDFPGTHSQLLIFFSGELPDIRLAGKIMTSLAPTRDSLSQWLADMKIPKAPLPHGEWDRPCHASHTPELLKHSS